MSTATDYTDFAPYDMPVEERRKINIGDIFFNQVKCLKCNWLIRSKNRHHMVTCKCGAVSVDGGSWYCKVLGEPADVESHVVMYQHLPAIPE